MTMAESSLKGQKTAAFSKDLYCRHIKTRACLGKALNTFGKGQIACNEQFLLFAPVFSTHLAHFLPFSPNLKLSSANAFSLERSKKFVILERVKKKLSDFFHIFGKKKLNDGDKNYFEL